MSSVMSRFSFIPLEERIVLDATIFAFLSDSFSSFSDGVMFAGDSAQDQEHTQQEESKVNKPVEEKTDIRNIG